MINKWIGIGNICRDPETRFMQDGVCVCNITIACTEKFKSRAGEKQERTEFIKVVLWGRLGEVANQYLKKGARVYIEGKIVTRSYEKDGETKYATEIKAHEMKMLGGIPNSGNQNGDSRPGDFDPNDPFADKPDF